MACIFVSVNSARARSHDEQGVDSSCHSRCAGHCFPVYILLRHCILQKDVSIIMRINQMAHGEVNYYVKYDNDRLIATCLFVI